ncbi:MAG: CotH kinase family protein, partial [Planctomycetes bacterium]|nr:CotH kinase family protein [Planctomycetota bacterium]
ENFSIVLSSNEPGAVVHYTTNGSVPTANSPVAGGPISISTSTKLRMISIVPGQIPSRVRAEEFFKLNANAAAFTSTLPVLLIDTFGSIGPGNLVAGHFAVFEPNGRTGITSLSDLPTADSRIGIRWRGASTQNEAKHPYALELWEDGFNDDRDLELLGMPAESDWVLQGPYHWDRSATRNPFIFELSNQVGVYAPRTRLIEIFVNQNGGTINNTSDYSGIYVLMEKIKRGEDRVDIGQEQSPNFPLDPVLKNGQLVVENGRLAEGDITGGFMFKDDRIDPGDGGFSAGGASLAYVYPKEVDIEGAFSDAGIYLRNYINAFRAAVNRSDFTHPTLGLHYSEFIDVQAFIDHHILNELTWNVDGFVLSSYYKKPTNGKLEAAPIWDFDRAIESTDGRDNNPRSWYGNRFHTWWGRLLGDRNFAQAWIDRWTQWRRDEFSVENINAITDRLAAQLQPDPLDPNDSPQDRNYDRWPVYRPRFSGGFNSGQLNGTFLGEIEHQKAWLEARMLWIDGKFLVAPTFSNTGGEIAPGFTLSMDAPRGTIFYTLDGSDPRASGGGISAAAFEYDESDPADIARRRLDQNTLVTARVFDSSFNSDFVSVSGGERWSGLTSGTFTVDRPTLTITEINYNPRNSTDEEIAAGFVDEDLFEFVEIHNFGSEGSQAINLEGIQLTNGVAFDFAQGDDDVSSIAPGDYLVVVRNEDAFKMRYPGVSESQIAGEFSGALRNSGERLAMENQFSQVLANFRFEDGWYNITDGDGFTLSRRDDADTFADLDLKRSWRPSSELLGSPGAADPKTQPEPGAIVINEILTHTDGPTGDWIELLNTTDEPIDISGWYLSDEGDNLRKYRFPDGTIIAPGQFRVINQFGAGGFGENAVDVTIDPNGGSNANPGAFGLSELGDTVRLTAVDPVRIRENIDAAHVLPSGNLLISTGGAAVLGDNALTFGNGDLIEYDAGTGQATLFFSEKNFLVFDPLSMTFSPVGNEDIDAVSIDPNTGHLILSTDGPALLPGKAGTPQVVDGVLSFGNGDLIAFDPATRTATLLLSEAVFAGGNENIDAVHVRGDGSLIISTRGPATIVGDETQRLFDDGDLIEIIPGNNANLAEGKLGDGATVRLFVSESIFAINAGNTEPTEDIDAVYLADGGAIILSTTSDATFASPLDFAFLNGDLVELTPGAGSDLGAVPANLGAGPSTRLIFEENPAGRATFLGEVGGFRERGSFGAAESEVTFGLNLKSDGTTDFSAQSAPTKGFANAAPLVGPVVINEIMYHPVRGEVEYIELLNITGTTVSLFDAANPDNTWQFTNGVNFAFPKNTSLAPSEHVLVLPKTPSQFADFDNFAADFRANHNVPASVQIFGPYIGALSNGGEALELSKPGDPEPNGFVPFILVDRVRYDDRLPWPVLADGGRSSLSRKDAAAYGSDAINWAPSTTDGTPGRVNIALDNSPPSVPANLSAVVNSESRITVSWDPSTDSETGVSFYRVLRNDKVVEPNFNATTYVDSDVAPNVTFIYEVSAVNADAFESDRSSPLPVNILAVPATEATEVTRVKVIYETVLEASSATDISNYVITGPTSVTISGASVDAEGRTVTLTTSPLLEGRRYVLRIENVVASTPGSQLPVAAQVNIDVPDLTLPTINAVRLRGSNWSQELLDRLEADQQGQDGFAVPTGPDQLKTLPWSGVDTVVIQFSEHVIVRESDLLITGVNRAGYPFSDFQYDAGTFTATWTLPGAILGDKLALNLKDRVRDPGDNAIDGNWIDGTSTFPSGDGQRQSNDNFQFRLNVLPGDVDGSGAVGRGDLLAALGQIGRDA